MNQKSGQKSKREKQKLTIIVLYKSRRVIQLIIELCLNMFFFTHNYSYYVQVDQYWQMLSLTQHKHDSLARIATLAFHYSIFIPAPLESSPKNS